MITTHKVTHEGKSYEIDLDPAKANEAVSIYVQCWRLKKNGSRGLKIVDHVHLFHILQQINNKFIATEVTMHYTDQTHFFRDADGNRTTVVTGMTGSDDIYEAVIIEGEHTELGLCGEGWSRFAAIADLNERIAKACADV